jgi:hypothetical protein
MAAAVSLSVTDLARASLAFFPKYVSETVRLQLAAAAGEAEDEVCSACSSALGKTVHLAAADTCTLLE